MTDRVNNPAVNYKPRIMEYLMRHRTVSPGWSRWPQSVDRQVDAVAMARALGLPLHDLVHVLWSLQKQDAIRFRERSRATKGRGGYNQQGRDNLDRFQITKIGAELHDSYQQTAPKAQTQTQDVMAGIPPVLMPGSVPMQITPLQADAILVADDIRQDSQPRRLNGAIQVAAPAEDPAGPSFVEHVLGRPLRPVPGPTGEITHPPLSPVLAAVLARRSAFGKVRDAAAALEAAGQDDAALALLATIPEDTIEDAICEHLLAEGYGA